MPAESWRIMPERSMSLWLATTASLGVSFTVGINIWDWRMGCICHVLASSSMLAILLVAGSIVAAAPSAKHPREKAVLVLDLGATDVAPNTAKLLTELVSDASAKAGMKTVSAADLRRVAQVNADRADAGCDTTSCLAELANAMGVELVLFGDVGKLGDNYLVTLRLFDADKAEAVARETIEGATLDDVQRGIKPAVA